MGRGGYFGCLVLLGVAMLSISCLAVFGATGAITAERGSRVAPVAAPRSAEPSRPASGEGAAPSRDSRGEAAPAEGVRPEGPAKADAAAKSEPPKTTASAKGEPAATKPAPVGTIPPKPAATGPEGNIAQRLDREAVGGGLSFKALGAAKTTQGDRAVLAIYVRMENQGATPIKIDPSYFRLLDRQGTRYPISKAIEASLPAIELAPKAAGAQVGQNTEGNLTFEVPRTAGGLALTYEPPDGPPLRIPLPPEFG